MDILSYNLFLKAVGNKTRAEIINLLRRGPKNVSQICRELGFEQSRVSHALGCLATCGFVSGKWEKGRKVYSLNGEIKPILTSIDRHIEKYRKELLRCGVLKEEK
jgi:DNA-binding transcriptional ArsR family regulator